MGVLTLAMAKAYTDSQRLAYIETTEGLTFDGDRDGKESIGPCYKISDVPINVDDVTEIAIRDNSSEVILSKDAFEINRAFDNGITAISGRIESDSGSMEGVWVLSVGDNATFEGTSVAKGTYVCRAGSKVYVTEVRGVVIETIHPIDPKYIVLTSSSGKKFNLSVDDSGTVSATEVV